jgi:hypothetical protein
LSEEVTELRARERPAADGALMGRAEVLLTIFQMPSHVDHI